MSFFLAFILSILVGYLFGSIPFALIVSKLFFGIDVRDYGSHNLGTTNVARTLGPTTALIVLIFDASKSGLTATIFYLIARNNIEDPTLAGLLFCSTGFAAAIGHCFPIFAKFKGGKAVATILGFMAFSNYRITIVALAIFITLVLIKKIVSLSSISAAIIVPIVVFIPFFKECYPFLNESLVNTPYAYSITILLLGLLLILRHIPNIKRLIKHEEKTFHFGRRKDFKK